MQRSTEEITARCFSVLENESIVSLVKASSSPTAAYKMVFEKTKSISKAKAGRWLAVLRRDYPAEYSEIISAQTSHINNDKA